MIPAPYRLYRSIKVIGITPGKQFHRKICLTYSYLSNGVRGYNREEMRDTYTKLTKPVFSINLPSVPIPNTLGKHSLLKNFDEPSFQIYVTQVIHSPRTHERAREQNVQKPVLERLSLKLKVSSLVIKHSCTGVGICLVCAHAYFSNLKLVCYCKYKWVA